MEALYYGIGAFSVAFLLLASWKLLRARLRRPKPHTVMLALNYGLEPRPGETDEELRVRTLQSAQRITRYPREL